MDQIITRLLRCKYNRCSDLKLLYNYIIFFLQLSLHLWVTFVLLTYKPEIHSEKSQGDL